MVVQDGDQSRAIARKGETHSELQFEAPVPPCNNVYTILLIIKEQSATGCRRISVVSEKGNIMKTGILSLTLATMISLTSLPAHADITGGGALGAIAGGLLGSQVGQGNGRIAASCIHAGMSR